MDLDGSSTNGVPDAPRPAAGSERPSDQDEPPSLRAQIGATFAAIKRLIRAHVELAKAELGEIMGAVGRMVGLFAGAFVLVLFAANLLFVGGLLWLGDWLFGSIGWGVLLGTLLLIDGALVAVLVALDVPASRIRNAFLGALVLGLLVGVPLALDLGHRAWVAAGDAVAPQYDESTRTVLLAVGVLAAIGAILGFLAGVRGGIGQAFGFLVGGAIVGAVVGVLTSVSLPGTVGAGLGVLTALIAWPVLAGLDVMRKGIDQEAMKAKFTPTESMTQAKETAEWVRARMPLAPKS